MKKSDVVNFKRMLLKYELSVEDLDYIKELQSEINSDFNSAIAALKRPDLFESKKVENLAEEAKVKEEVESEDREPAFKKLFRKVVIVTHPDKFTDDMSLKEKALKQDLYERAVKANDAYNWAELITVAIKLEIELGEEYQDKVDALRVEIDKIHMQISTIEGSIAWKWYHSPDEQKDVILQSYIKHLEKVVNGPKVEKKLILGVGHPRTGTGFTSKLLQTWGLEVGHETMGKDGIVAWQLTVKEGPWPFISENYQYDYQYVIYCVRDPRKSLPSIVYTENTKETSFNYRKSNIKRVMLGNPVENAIRMLIEWDRLIYKNRKPNLIYRIEYDSKNLYDFLIQKELRLSEYQPIDVPINSREHKSFEEMLQEYPKIGNNFKNEINSYCEKYGYDKLF